MAMAVIRKYAKVKKFSAEFHCIAVFYFNTDEQAIASYLFYMGRLLAYVLNFFLEFFFPEQPIFQQDFRFQ